MKDEYRRDHHQPEHENTIISEPEVEIEAAEEQPVIEVEAEQVVRGEVANCIQVFLRSEPTFDNNMLVILGKGTEVFIDENFEHELFYKVKASAPKEAEGYIVKGFVEKR